MTQSKSTFLAIAVGGFVAGILDLLAAFYFAGPNTPLLIAGGLRGPQALHEGTATYVLGVMLHFFIAFTVATIYWVASRWMT
jgi:hypothetical protein